MSDLTLGSLFDGSGGFPLGGILSGIVPVWASEIEPFPIRVTTKRLPFMKHYGDVSALSGHTLEPVSIITFGSPCQDMSIAGKREGLDGSRSSLFYEAIRIIKEMRETTHGRKPEFIVWENVPGAFSSNHGEDFRCVIESICRICEKDVSVPEPDKWNSSGEVLGDGYSIAWRVLDAQYWGVTQRRKRIYLVADLGGSRAGKILFESEGLPWHPGESFKTREKAAGDPGESSSVTGLCLNDQGGCRMDVTHDVVSTLRAESHHPPITLYENHSQDSRYNGPLSTADTVTARYGTGGNNQPLVVATPKTLKIRSGCDGGGYSENGVGFTLNATEQHAFAVSGVYHSSKSSFHTNFSNEDAVETLMATDYKVPPTVSREPEYIVRRLTPTECARLQGFHDWWCGNLGTDAPTDEEMDFWREVFETHRRLVTHAKKPKTDSQIRKWLKDPHTVGRQISFI